MILFITLISLAIIVEPCPCYSPASAHASPPPRSHLSKIARKHSKNGCLSIMPMLCQTRPLATLSAQTEPSRYLSDQARPRPRQDPPQDPLPCPTTAVILASVLKIEHCMAVCQLLAGILGLIGHLRTAASTPLDEATGRRAATSTVTSVMMPCRPGPRCHSQERVSVEGLHDLGRRLIVRTSREVPLCWSLPFESHGNSQQRECVRKL
mmetsp:Transcript_63964/g.142891  ORF Transcript_63964/g.142891 Transcript_63964/m.142891 type:complete len:209 (+) Transcript_63964:33-659(+)